MKKCFVCHRFPLNNENLLNKWIAVVGKPNWRPKKTSRICSLHFSEKDIIRGMGYKYFYLRENAVPKNYSSIVAVKEQIDIAMFKSKNNYNAASKSVSFNETCVLNKSAIRDHDYSNNINTTIENNELSTFGIQDSDQLVQRTILHPDKKRKFIQTDFKRICNTANMNNSISFSEICVLNKSVAWDHSYSRNNVSITIENDESSIFDTQDPNKLIQKAILQLDEKRKFILIDSKNGIALSPFLHSSTNFKSKKEIDFTAEKIQKLSSNIKNIRKKNKILQQKLRRYKKKIISMKEMFNRLQNNLSLDESFQLIKKQFNEETMRILR